MLIEKEKVLEFAHEIDCGLYGETTEVVDVKDVESIELVKLVKSGMLYSEEQVLEFLSKPGNRLEIVPDEFPDNSVIIKWKNGDHYLRYMIKKEDFKLYNQKQNFLMENPLTFFILSSFEMLVGRDYE